MWIGRKTYLVWTKSPLHFVNVFSIFSSSFNSSYFFSVQIFNRLENCSLLQYFVHKMPFDHWQTGWTTIYTSFCSLVVVFFFSFLRTFCSIDVHWIWFCLVMISKSLFVVYHFILSFSCHCHINLNSTPNRFNFFSLFFLSLYLSGLSHSNVCCNNLKQSR